MTYTREQKQLKRVVILIHAVARRLKLQAYMMLGPQNPRDGHGTCARYAVWWMARYRMGMTLAEIGAAFRMTAPGISAGLRKIEEVVEDDLAACQAMLAAQAAVARAIKKFPLASDEAERVAKFSDVDWQAKRKEPVQ